jgi:hypothetical protein
MVNFILPYEANYKSTTKSRVADEGATAPVHGPSMKGQIACGVDRVKICS